MVPQQIKEFAAFCRESGITRFYAGPGSRSASILLSLIRTAGIKVEMLGDERSAAYRALGYAAATQHPVGLLCTSGTAVLNLGPAIAEAFYQGVPLIIVTADRPPELIDQQEGQAVRQAGIFEKHTLYSANVPSFESSVEAQLHARRLYNEAYYACTGQRKGPVHLNFPVREPFYPDENEDFSVNHPIRVNISKPDYRLSREVLSELIELWNAAPRRLLTAGQMAADSGISNACKALSEYAFCPLAGDALHNLESIPGSVLHADLLPEYFLASTESKAGILISIGDGLLSKSLKKYLQKNQPLQHWHVQKSGYPADPFGTITRIIHADPEWFLTKLGEASCFSPVANRQESESWFSAWQGRASLVRHTLSEIGVDAGLWSDLDITAVFLKSLPEQAVLFLASSMPVRYACWLYEGKKSIQFFSNRGTSGIDGCLSTAIGVAEAMPERKVFALLGDMAFLYDRNAFWTRNIPSNLKILVLNNSGGNIFRLLPASSALPEMEEYFEMRQSQTTEGICADAGVNRFSAGSPEEWKAVFPQWLATATCSVLEVFTEKESNHIRYREFRKSFADL